MPMIVRKGSMWLIHCKATKSEAINILAHNGLNGA
jgi:hypothetical protein